MSNPGTVGTSLYCRTVPTVPTVGTLGTYGTVGTYLRYGTNYSRERNLLALPTLDMYLPLSKFESIQRVYIALRCNNKLL